MYYLREAATGKEVSTDNFVFTGDRSPWEVIMDMEAIKKRINRNYFGKSPPYVSKYLPLMPIAQNSEFISLEEGSTPLIRSKCIGPELGIDLYFKVEGKNPTGSFKDRGSAVDLSIAREFGAKGIILASTGNMAASCSCYAAAAKMPCFVVVPEDTPSSKLAQVIAFGGKVVKVKGSYDAAARLAKEAALEFNFYLAGDYAFRVEGQKTAAFELIDQFFFREPDYVVVPIGCGTNITAWGKGFREYKELGFIENLPKLIGTQAEGASAVVKSFNKGSKEIEPLQSVSTICTAISVGDPLDGIKALREINSSSGAVYSVSDMESLQAQYFLSRQEGIFAEISCATSIACVNKLAKSGRIKPNSRVVCVITGEGLKDTTPILKAAIQPPTIFPNVKSFKELYNSSVLSAKNVLFAHRHEVLIEHKVNDQRLVDYLSRHFGTTYTKEIRQKIFLKIQNILKKGKSITFADLQDIIQDVLEETPRPKGGAFLVIEDFKVITGKDMRAKAWVVAMVNGEKIKTESEGVGPVDAVINSLKKACSGSMDFLLSRYRVSIRGEGTDALVYTEIKLIQGPKVSIGNATSPDLLQASIEAFSEAYNGFGLVE